MKLCDEALDPINDYLGRVDIDQKLGKRLYEALVYVQASSENIDLHVKIAQILSQLHV